jgi:DNA helicase-2/ATP-dependent DNA helicase PcrA
MVVVHSPIVIRMAAYLDRLNPEQRLAVEHGVGHPDARPLLVIAGAGSGKTDTLAHRVAHLIVNGADPRRILLLTFSRRAASEMARRAERIVKFALAGQHAFSLPWSGTFHAVGARLLREHAPEIGLDAAFTIHDREDAADLMNLVRHELSFSQTKERFPTKGTCLAIYSRAVNAREPLDAVLAKVFPWCAGWAAELRALFAAYVEAKQRQNVLDYDDLLLYWAQMAAEPVLAAEIASRFDHVLVDEYQDTNALQGNILLALKPDGRGMTVVGDDAQSIYSFRAATVRNILDFPNQFSPAARIVTLERNYRSTGAILAASNAVIALAAERHSKTLWSERVASTRPLVVAVRDEGDQARYVAERVLENREAGVALKNQAVLFRAAHHSDALEVELTRRNIPFVKFGGLKFLDSAHVKDMLACLRLAENPRDRVAGFRVLQLLPGVGPTTAGRVLDRLAAPDAAAMLTAYAPPRAGAAWEDFATLFGRLLRRESGWPAELGQVREWYEPHLQRIHEDAHMRAADLNQLEQIAAGYPTRERFLTDLTLDPPNATSDESGAPLLDEDYLILSTIHSAKGQEWKSVFVLNAVDGCIPSDLATGSTDEIEEERRLLYVAMTRAKDDLDLVVPHRFYVHSQARNGDGYVHASRTRFIPPSVLRLFEQRVWPQAARTAQADKSAAQRPRVDLNARMRAMWR